MTPFFGATGTRRVTVRAPGHFTIQATCDTLRDGPVTAATVLGWLGGGHTVHAGPSYREGTRTTFSFTAVEVRA